MIQIKRQFLNWYFILYSTKTSFFIFKFLNWITFIQFILSECFYLSGEMGFRGIADHFGLAKNPMINRINKVDKDTPIWFVFGGLSWIKSTSGLLAADIRHQANAAPVTVKVYFKLTSRCNNTQLLGYFYWTQNAQELLVGYNILIHIKKYSLLYLKQGNNWGRASCICW